MSETSWHMKEILKSLIDEKQNENKGLSEILNLMEMNDQQLEKLVAVFESQTKSFEQLHKEMNVVKEQVKTLSKELETKDEKIIKEITQNRKKLDEVLEALEKRDEQSATINKLTLEALNNMSQRNEKFKIQEEEERIRRYERAEYHQRHEHYRPYAARYQREDQSINRLAVENRILRRELDRLESKKTNSHISDHRENFNEVFISDKQKETHDELTELLKKYRSGDNG